MDFNEYQEKTRQTAVYPKEKALEYVVLGLLSEAGEVAGKLKKVIRDSGGVLTEEKRKDIVAETGDCFWYLSELCTALGVKMEDVAQQNVDKLFSRKERGVIGGSGDNR